MGNILEQGAGEAIDGRPAVLQTPLEAGAVFTRMVDFNAASDIVIRFPKATQATIAAVEAFATKHRTGSFPYTLPNGGPTIQCDLVEHPDIRRRTGRAASITVRIRRTLLID